MDKGSRAHAVGRRAGRERDCGAALHSQPLRRTGTRRFRADCARPASPRQICFARLILVPPRASSCSSTCPVDSRSRPPVPSAINHDSRPSTGARFHEPSYEDYQAQLGGASKPSLFWGRFELCVDCARKLRGLVAGNATCAAADSLVKFSPGSVIHTFP